ncbi:MAG: hypothetical protein Kow0063_44380 [Anaerolineae bacterium]
MAKIRKPEIWAGLFVILLATLLYFATLDTGLRPDELSGGDLITHQYAQVQARPGNAPGYPLYTMGGWLWFRLTRPLAGQLLNPVQRLASYSTLWALLSLFVLYHLIVRVTQRNWLVAALSTAFYATTYFFWYYSVTTEQYTSAIFQTLLIVWLAFRWDETQSRDEPGDHYLVWMAFVVGTCLANLVTTLFIVPPLLWFVLSRRRDLWRQPRLVTRSAMLGLLPVLSYLYVYLRGAAHPEWRGAGQWPNTWTWFVDFLTTRQGRDELAPGLTLDQFVTDEFPSIIWGELTWVVLVGGLLGIWWLGRRRAIFVYSTLAIYLIFCWIDRFGNWFQVILPAYPLIVLGLAAGLNALWRIRLQSGGWRLAARGLILAALVSLVAYRFATSLPRADQRYRPEDTGLDPGWAVLSDQPLPHSVILSEHSEWLALEYLANIWGAEPVVYPYPVCQSDLPGLNQASHNSPQVSAIYLTRRAVAVDPACLADRHRYAAGAELIQVRATPNTELPASAHSLSLEFGPHLRLAGFELQPPPDSSLRGAAQPHHLPPAENRYHLSLYWETDAPLSLDYTVSVRLLDDGALILDPSGEPVIQDHQPVWNSYPTSRWLPGEIVRDDYSLQLPGDVTPDSVQVLVYRSTATGFENLGQAELSLPPASSK